MAHLREAIAMVLQKNTLFSGNLLDNLRWGKEDASMEEIEEACRIACVDEVLERLPEGMRLRWVRGASMCPAARSSGSALPVHS